MVGCILCKYRPFSIHYLDDCDIFELSSDILGSVLSQEFGRIWVDVVSWCLYWSWVEIHCAIWKVICSCRLRKLWATSQAQSHHQIYKLGSRHSAPQAGNRFECPTLCLFPVAVRNAAAAIATDLLPSDRIGMRKNEGREIIQALMANMAVLEKLVTWCHLYWPRGSKLVVLKDPDTWQSTF